MIVLGIDVGKSGALAIVDIIDGIAEVELIDFGDKRIIPTLEALQGDVAMCLIEKVASMPNQGVKSTFSFGENFGWWQGVLDAIGIPFQMVRPQDWMKSLYLPKDRAERKKEIHKVASRLYPNAQLNGKQGGIKDGRSDALMIAHYGRRIYASE